MVFSYATFNNSSVISSVLLVEENHSEKTIDLPKVTDRLYHIMLYRIHIAISEIRTHNVSGEMGLNTHVAVNQTTIRSRPRLPLKS